jgi:hypothetical protein
MTQSILGRADRAAIRESILSILQATAASYAEQGDPESLDDARRIIAMAALASGRPRWRHGYLVTILRRSELEAHRLVRELTAQIQALRATASTALPDHQKVKVTAEMRNVGASRINSQATQIYGVVFHIALVDRLVPEAEADDSPDDIA